MGIFKGIRILVLLIMPVLGFIGCDWGLTDEQINEKYSKMAISIYRYNSEQQCRSIAHSVIDPSGLKIYIPKGYRYSVRKSEKSFEVSSYSNERPQKWRNEPESYDFMIVKNVPAEDSKTNFKDYILDDMKISAFPDYRYDDNDIIHVSFERPIGRGLKFWSQGGFKSNDQLVEIVCDIKLNYLEMQNRPDILKRIQVE
jgi:hypothetical protein